MAALAEGMGMVLSVADRLRVYAEYFSLLPRMTTEATGAFEKCLVKMYAIVLRFLDDAVETYGKSSGKRFASGIWKVEELDGFRKECTAWTLQVGLDIDNCDRELERGNEVVAREWRRELEGRFADLGSEVKGIKGSLGKLNERYDLGRLMSAAAPQAIYDSLDEETAARCLPGTRKELLGQIVDWIGDAEGKLIFWLRGMAGTGKSAVSRTVAHTLDLQRRLGTGMCAGASFFFKRGEGDRGDARRLFPTIALQLAAIVPGLDRVIADAIGKDPLVFTKGLQTQFQTLILDPLVDLMQSDPISLSIVLILDALDECESVNSVPTILEQLARFRSVDSVQVRIFVTSRPEAHINEKFDELSELPESLHQDIRLETVQESTIEQDIRTYFEYELAMIRNRLRRRREPYDNIAIDWPGKDNTEKLVKLALPLFIFASTVCRFVGERDSQRRMELVIQQEGSKVPSGIAKTYLPILEQAVQRVDGQERQDAIAKLRGLIGPIVILERPLSIPTLSRLLDREPGDVYEILEDLQSVMNVPKNYDDPVRLLHLSFRDFLVDANNKDGNSFWIDRTEIHAILARQCFWRLSLPGTLKADICSVKKQGTLRSNVKQERVARSIPHDVAYACLYWVFHMAKSNLKVKGDGPEYEFLTLHFLHWLEALSWLGRFSTRTLDIDELEGNIETGEMAVLRPSLFSEFVQDAQRFALWSRAMADLAPLQLYSSGLMFAPESSVVKVTFLRSYPTKFSVYPSPPPNWDGIQYLEGHTHDIHAMAFSSSGERLASASEDMTVRIWDTKSGAEIQKLEGQCRCDAIAYHPSNERKLLASVGFDVKMNDTAIQIWNLETGEQIVTLKGHDRYLRTIAFSPHDGKLLASSSMIWDTTTWDEVCTRDGPTYFVGKIDFCPKPDSRLLALCTIGGTTRLWDIALRKEIWKLDGRGKYTLPFVFFSPDGQNLITSREDDKRFQLVFWHATTLEQSEVLESPAKDAVVSIGFMTDVPGSPMLAASEGGTIYTRRDHTDKLRPVMHIADALSPITIFSPAADMLASAEGKSIQLWDLSRAKDISEKPKYQRIQALRYSANGKFVISVPEIGQFEVYNITGDMVACKRWDCESIQEVAISSNGETIASVDLQARVRVWNAATGEELGHYQDTDDWVSAVALSDSGRTLAYSGFDYIRVKDTADKTKSSTYATGREFAQIRFSEDGSSIKSDVETLDLTQGTFSPTPEQPDTPGVLDVADGWIRYKKENLLWLPPQYRVGHTVFDKGFIAKDDSVVIVQGDGNLAFYTLDGTGSSSPSGVNCE